MGYSMPEVGETYERGLLLSRRSGDRKHLFSLLSGAWFFHIVRGDLEESRRLGQDCVDGARREGVPPRRWPAAFCSGPACFIWDSSPHRASRSSRRCGPRSVPSDPALALFAGPDVGVFCRAYLSHVFWHLGDAEQAPLRTASEAIALAREVSHPFSLAIALDYAAMLNVFRQEAQTRAGSRAGEASRDLPQTWICLLSGVGGHPGGLGDRRAKATLRPG